MRALHVNQNDRRTFALACDKSHTEMMARWGSNSTQGPCHARHFFRDQSPCTCERQSTIETENIDLLHNLSSQYECEEVHCPTLFRRETLLNFSLILCNALSGGDAATFDSKNNGTECATDSGLKEGDYTSHSDEPLNGYVFFIESVFRRRWLFEIVHVHEDSHQQMPNNRRGPFIKSVSRSRFL